MHIGILALSWAITFGFHPQIDDIIMGPDQYAAVSHTGSYMVDVALEASIGGLVFVRNSTKTYMVSAPNSVLFNPFRSDYSISVEARTKWVNIGISHECDHGVDSSYDYQPWYGKNETMLYVQVHS